MEEKRRENEKGNEKKREKKTFLPCMIGNRKERERERKREISFIPFAKRRKMGTKKMYIHKKLNSMAAHF